MLKDRALMDEAQLDAHYASAYGIFGGVADRCAMLSGAIAMRAKFRT
jgi:hypothetical protein